MKSFYDITDPEEASNYYFKGYDNMYGKLKLNKVQKLIKELKNLKTARVLDVGCCCGIYTKFFIDEGARVICLDINKVFLEANKKINPMAKFIMGNAVDIDLKEKFDLIFASDIIEHIDNDQKFLQNMNKHLKTEGILFLNTQNSFSLNYLIEGSLYFWFHGKGGFLGWGPTHIRFYNFMSLKRKLRQAGFKPIKWFSNYHLPSLYKIYTGREHKSKFPHTIEILNLHNRFPFSFLGWGIGVIAKKVM